MIACDASTTPFFHHELPRAPAFYYDGVDHTIVKDLIVLFWFLVVVPSLHAISWANVLSRIILWLDFLTGGLLLICSVLRCLSIEGDIIGGQLLETVAGTCMSSSILPESNAQLFTHFSTVLWGCSVYFEGRSVFLLGKRLFSMRAQSHNGHRWNCRSVICSTFTGLGTIFMAVVFSIYFTYVYQSLREVSLGPITTVSLPLVGLVEGGKIILQGIVLCGYLFGLNLRRDMNIQYDFFRIGCSNFIMLINCLGLLYSFSPLQIVLSDNEAYPFEYVNLTSVLVDIVLRIAYGAYCFWVSYKLQPRLPQEDQLDAMHRDNYVRTSSGLVFDVTDKKELLIYERDLREATQPIQSALIVDPL